MKKQLSIRTMTSIAVLSAVAFVLAFFEFPVPLSPSFARMDHSDFPALIGAFAFGPVAGPGDCILRSVYPIYQNKAGCCSVQCIPIQFAEWTCDNWIHNARI